MESAVQVIGSFLAAALGWVALEFVARPLRRFFDMRGEVIRRLTEYGNIKPRWREVPGDRKELELSADEIARLEMAQHVLRDLASQLVAFASNETWALYAAKAMGHDPKHAAEGLLGLSNRIDTHDPQDHKFHRKTIKQGLFRDRRDVM
jgi:hypothetical protein